MKEGLIFVWTEKEYISDVVDYFESKDIKYVENLVFARLDSQSGSKLLNIFYNLFLNFTFTLYFIVEDASSSKADPFNLTNMFSYEEYTYFTKCHSTLLIFRKVRICIFYLVLDKQQKVPGTKTSKNRRCCFRLL